MSLLDSLFGIQHVLVKGIELVTRKTANFSGWVSGSDNATEARTELSILPPYATEAPSSGTYARGDLIFNAEPSAGGTVGWVCIEAGSPGTWKAFGDIEPD